MKKLKLENSEKIKKFGKVYTVCYNGMNVHLTEVEAHAISGIPSFNIVGLGDKAISESRDRVRSALFINTYQLPIGRLIINLSPAAIQKEGTHYDLPIAVSILNLLSIINNLNEFIFIGELTLSGDILPARGIISFAIFALKNNKTIVCCENNYEELKLLPGVRCLFANNIRELILLLKNPNPLITSSTIIEKKILPSPIIYGQEFAVYALTIAAIGRHHMLFVGAPGVGKTTLVHALPYILPNLSENEKLEVSEIYSRAGILSNELIHRPPLRQPHSSASLVSIIGGCDPGEISFAHHGILFLDEAPEFGSKILDALRTPLEEQLVYVARAKYRITYPANIQLIMAMNPCKCGLRLEKRCSCNKRSIISGPILDRIDITVHLKKDQSKTITELPSMDIIKKARIKQEERGIQNSRLTLNHLMNLIDNNLIMMVHNTQSLREKLKILRLALTISEFHDDSKVTKEHIYEAMTFKGLNIE